MSSANRTQPGGPPSGGQAWRSAYEVLAVASRALILEQVRGHREGVDTATLARLTGLHSNTVRFHLDVLAEAGLVSVSRIPTGKPGRPRLLFSTVQLPPPESPGPPDGSPRESQDGYALLAAVLVRHLDRLSGDSADVAEAAGRAWVPQRPAGSGSGPATSDEQAVAEVTALFDEIGFAPQTVRDREGWRILLHRCPFHALAAEHPEIVCRLHLGLLQGAVDRLGLPSETVRLQPFVAPGLCEAFVPLTSIPAGSPE